MFDSAILVTLTSFLLLIAAYFIYGRFVARRLFHLSPQRRTPAHVLHDGVDYIPTRPWVLFGHHFASIAGLGPILGPAVAVIWGWLPAVLWVVIGSIFVGAVHDLGALTISLKYKGRSIGDIGRELIGPRARMLFLLIIFFLMSLAMGAFVNAISSLFVSFNPDAIIPSFGLMIVAICVGVAMYKLHCPMSVATVAGLLGFGGLILWGVAQPITSYDWFLSPESATIVRDARLPQDGEPAPVAAPYGAAQVQTFLQATNREQIAAELLSAESKAKSTWIFILLGYGFVASVLPVWLLLQPRDYINSFQLYIALALLVTGLLLAGMRGSDMARLQAPLIQTNVPGAPNMFPFLFVTIACGAVSGFHSLVASGTTVRQLNRETDAIPIGFGGMLTEGALAVLVIMACAAGLGAAAWGPGGAYASWKTAGGLAAPLNAVVEGGGNFLANVGIPPAYGQAFLAVTVVAFALTTLDSATRLLRFNVEEIFRSVGLERMANRYIASLVAVAGIAAFGLLPAGKALWVLFGTTNQLLAALTLLTVSLFLYKLSRPVIYTVLPMIFMLVMTVWAMIASLITTWSSLLERLGVGSLSQLLDSASAMQNIWQQGDLLLILAVSLIILAMTAWLIVEAMLSFARGREDLQLDGDEWPAGKLEEKELVESAHIG